MLKKRRAVDHRKRIQRPVSKVSFNISIPKALLFFFFELEGFIFKKTLKNKPMSSYVPYPPFSRFMGGVGGTLRAPQHSPPGP